jgi:hypothetical protein
LDNAKFIIAKFCPTPLNGCRVCPQPLIPSKINGNFCI